MLSELLSENSPAMTSTVFFPGGSQNCSTYDSALIVTLRARAVRVVGALPHIPCVLLLQREECYV